MSDETIDMDLIVGEAKEEESGAIRSIQHLDGMYQKWFWIMPPM